jgi:hypothetical protein
VLQEKFGGRTWARTKDPLINSHFFGGVPQGCQRETGRVLDQADVKSSAGKQDCENESRD